jgi:Zn-dependent protease
MLGQVSPTPYDLRFSLFGIPVRVHPFFWVMGCLFAWPSQQLPGSVVFEFLAIGIACLFVSILVHEMGHALTARHFGWPPEVVLYQMGGYALFFPSWGHTPQRSVLVSLAGPAAGFLLYAGVWGSSQVLLRRGVELNWQTEWAIMQLEWINLWWGLVNLLPVYPLDGGQTSRTVLSSYWPRNGLQLSLQISIVVAGSAAVYFFTHQMQFAAILFAMLCFESLQTIQRSGRGYR